MMSVEEGGRYRLPAVQRTGHAGVVCSMMTTRSGIAAHI